MTNADALRKIINESSIEDGDEAMGFIDAMEEEITDLKEALKESDGECKDLQDQLDDVKVKADKYDDLEFDPDDMKVEFLGLDTINYHFKEGNLKIQQQFENWLRSVKQQNSAGVMLPI